MENPAKFESSQQKDVAERVLEMSPSELVDFLTDLQEKEELEKFLLNAEESVIAKLGYWEKWLSEDCQELVEKVVEKTKEAYGEKSDSLPLELEKKFTKEELELIFSHLGAIQLTFGCSKGCPFCGVDALPGVREHIPYSQVANLFQRYGEELKISKPFGYWASEPSDYTSEDRTYPDFHRLAVEYGGYNPSVTSKNIDDKEWLDFLGSSAKGARVSVFGVKEERVEEILEEREIEAVGRKDTHVKGIGVSYGKEKEDSKDNMYGIGCINGVLMTPRGVYSVVQMMTCEKYPQGQIVVPIEKLSDEDIKEGDNLEAVLRKKIPLSGLHRGVKPLDNLIIGSVNKRQRVWFDQEGIITRVEDYSEKEKYFEDNLEELFTEALEERNIKFICYDLSEEDKKLVEEELKKIDYRKIIVERHDYLLRCFVNISIPRDDKEKQIWIHFYYNLKRKRVGGIEAIEHNN